MSRSERRAAVLAYLQDRCGRAWLDGLAMAELRNRGLRHDHVERAVEDLADAGIVTVRRGVDRVFVQLAEQPTAATPDRFPDRAGPRLVPASSRRPR